MVKKSTETDNGTNMADAVNSTEIPQSEAEPISTPVEDAAAPETQPAEAQLATQLIELTNDLQRTRADFENYRKQTELQRSQAMSVARFATVEKFLPLVDDFSRAIASYPEQLSPLAKNLDKLLSGLGLSQIDSQPGTEFNPDFHEAVSVDDGEGDKEIVIETLRPGYLYEGSVLRPAMVKVGHTK